MRVILHNTRDIGALIRDRRLARGLSQQELAGAVGVSRLWIHQVERGKPRAEMGLVLRALHVLGLQLTAEDRDSAPGGPDLDAIVDQARGANRDG